MKWAIALAVALAPFTPSLAVACDCPMAKDPAKRERTQREASVKLRVLSFSMQRSEKDDPEGTSSAEVIEQPMNGTHYPERILVRASGGDEGANCGAASLLFESVSTGRDIRVDLLPAADGAYTPAPCALRQIDPWP